MSIECKYQINKEEVDFIYRILITIKRVWYLYLPDVFLLIWILWPPFSMEKLKIFIIAILLLGFRDITIIKQSQYYMERLKIEGSKAFLQILNFSKTHKVAEHHVDALNIQLNKRFCCSYMDIYLDNKLLHRQYAVGSYNFQKLHYLAEKVKQYQNENGKTKEQSG